MENHLSFNRKGVLLILPFFFLFLINFGSAATDTSIVDDTFKINTIVDYSKPCFDNGTYCSTSAVCNFTVYNPKDEIIVSNEQGTNLISRHNISLTFTDIGIYTINMVCHDGDRQGAETFYAQVTGNGFNDSIAFYILILALSLGIIILGFSMRDAPITILGSIGLYFLGLYILFNGIAGIKDPVTTWASGIVVLGLAMYISIRSAIELLTD